MSAHLIKEIEKLQKQLAELATCVEESLRQALHSLTTGDENLANIVIENDDYIDRKEIALEEECLKILALYQPVASDLRYVITCLKLNTELERIGDLAVNIAKRASAMHSLNQENINIDFSTMGRRTQELLQETLDALFKINKETAEKVIAKDDEIDEMHHQNTLKIANLAQQYPKQTFPLTYILGVSRSLERIADSCTNIAEDVIYMLNGAIVRHQNKE